jgi:crotonobetainyl-CoA:carnitine CoA-transferase CaiB-like acyl-CoA transferase
VPAGSGCGLRGNWNICSAGGARGTIVARAQRQGAAHYAVVVKFSAGLEKHHLAAQSDPDSYAGPRVGGANYPPERGWKTRDEPIFFAFGGSVGAEGRPGWVKFCEEAGFTRLLADPRFDKIGRDSTGYGVRVQELRAEYEREFARYTAEELVAMIRKHAGNAAAYQRADQAIEHTQTQALGVVQSVPRSDGGPVKVRTFPARFSQLRTTLKGDAPRFGEHTPAIAAELGVAAI